MYIKTKKVLNISQFFLWIDSLYHLYLKSPCSQLRYKIITCLLGIQVQNRFYDFMELLERKIFVTFWWDVTITIIVKIKFKRNLKLFFVTNRWMKIYFCPTETEIAFEIYKRIFHSFPFICLSIFSIRLFVNLFHRISSEWLQMKIKNLILHWVNFKTWQKDFLRWK